MKEIPLTKGHVAVVDDEDYERLTTKRWQALERGNTVHAMRKERVGGRKRTVFMHRMILGAQDGVEVDHIDRNGLNNTRGNLRPCFHQQNSWNRIKGGPKSSVFIGVCMQGSLARPTAPRWRASITVNGKQQWLGSFRSQVEAAIVYDNAARIHFGEFAITNFRRPQHGEI